MVNIIYVLSILEIGAPDLDLFGAFFIKSTPPPSSIDPSLTNRQRMKDLTIEKFYASTVACFTTSKERLMRILRYLDDPRMFKEYRKSELANCH